MVVNFLVPEGAFMRIMAVATAAAAITWMMIVLVHLRFRKAHARDALLFPAPFHPWTNYLCAAFLVLLVGLMTQLDDTRPAVYVLPVWLVALYAGYRLKRRAATSDSASSPVPAAAKISASDK